MKVKFDGKILETHDENETIVSLADKHGIHIEAPCHRNNKKYGSCAGCNVEVNGEDKYACVTKVTDGMVINYDREDLNQKRNQKLAKYYDLRAKGIHVKCGEICKEKEEVLMEGKIKIEFDGQEMVTDNESDNIVQIAEKNGVYIPAPCYRKNKGGGCCKGCNVEIDGQVRPACGSKVKDGMKVVYNREDLVENRKKNLLEYAKRIKNNAEPTNSSCCGSSSASESTSTSGGCCDSNNNNGNSGCGCS